MYKVILRGAKVGRRRKKSNCPQGSGSTKAKRYNSFFKLHFLPISGTNFVVCVLPHQGGRQITNGTFKAHCGLMAFYIAFKAYI